MRFPVFGTSAFGGIALALAACSEQPIAPEDPAISAAARGAASRVECDPDNGGITLPPGFCAVVVADLTSGGVPARARHMAVTTSGDLFVAINPSRDGQPAFGIIALRDKTGDGRADEQAAFSPGLGGSGIAWADGTLYFGANDRVLRFHLPAGRLTPLEPAATVVSGLPNTGDHVSKTVVLADEQTLYVNIGSASNACQVQNRVAQSPGVFPCPELPVRAGVWIFHPQRTGQTQSDGRRHATGLRNMVALAVHPATGELYGLQHGRDMLFENWPELFTVEEDAVLPAEEFVRIASGSDNGWPYCFHDAVFQHRKVLAPEYGGDGVLTSGSGINCADYTVPLASFGAHWAPNGLMFYTGKQFPARYRGGAFIAFHGGFDRAPLPNEGFKVMFVPMSGSGTPTGAAEVFADGFAGPGAPLPDEALHRPVGVTQGPDGSLYISDDRGGRIWRVVFRGQ
jgi:glucose/arabinose dehydrogenase